MSVRNQKDIPKKSVRPPSRLVVMNPSKGLNDLVSPSLIDDRELSDLMNVEYDEGGVLRKRYGYTPYGAALTAAKGLGTYNTESTAYMTTIDSGTLKYNTGAGWTSSTGASFTAGQETSFTQARLKLFIWNGVDGGAYFDSTNAVTRPGTMPKAKFSVYYQSYHICAGVTGQPNRLYVSNASDATDFTVATGGTQPQPDSTTDAENGITNVPGATVFAGTPSVAEARVFDIRKNDGDKITGLAIFQDVLIIFKERSIYQLTFDSGGLGTVTPITYATGCVSHKTIKAVENDVNFLSREGERILGNQPQFFTAIRTSVLSIKITNAMNSINKQYYSLCNSVYFDNKYITCVPTTSSSITRAIVLDRRFSAYTIWKNFNAQDMVRYIDSTNTENLYFLDTAGTRVYQRVAGQFNDNGSAIEAWVTLKAQDFGNPDLTKFFIDLRPIFRRLNGTITITLYVDGNVAIGTGTITSGSVRGLGRVAFGRAMLGTDGLTATETESFVDIPESIVVNQDSRTLKAKFYNNTVNENFVLLGYVYDYYPKSPFVFDSSRKIYL